MIKISPFDASADHALTLEGAAKRVAERLQCGCVVWDDGWRSLCGACEHEQGKVKESAEEATLALLGRDRLVMREDDGAEIPAEMGLEEFSQALTLVKRAERVLFWRQGDLLAFARNRWGAQFIRKLGLSNYQRKMMHTALLFPPGERVEALSAAHHRTCQEEGLRLPQAREALALASAEGMTVAGLRAHLRRSAETVVPDVAMPGMVDSDYLAFQKGTTFLVKHPPEDLEPTQRAAMRLRLRAFAEYYAELERLDGKEEG